VIGVDGLQCYPVISTTGSEFVYQSIPILLVPFPVKINPLNPFLAAESGRREKLTMGMNNPRWGLDCLFGIKAAEKNMQRISNKFPLKVACRQLNFNTLSVMSKLLHLYILLGGKPIFEIPGERI
jgi:hypothetical protein